MAASFGTNADPAPAAGEADIARLHAKICKLVVERDFLAKASGRLVVDRRRQMIEREHGQLSIVQQFALLSISRSGFYYEPTGGDCGDGWH